MRYVRDCRDRPRPLCAATNEPYSFCPSPQSSFGRASKGIRFAAREFGAINTSALNRVGQVLQFFWVAPGNRLTLKAPVIAFSGPLPSGFALAGRADRGD